MYVAPHGMQVDLESKSDIRRDRRVYVDRFKVSNYDAI